MRRRTAPARPGRARAARPLARAERSRRRRPSPRRLARRGAKRAHERVVRRAAFAPQLPFGEAELRRDGGRRLVVDVAAQQRGAHAAQRHVRAVVGVLAAARQRPAHVVADAFEHAAVGRGVTPVRRARGVREVLAHERVAAQFGRVVEVAQQVARRAIVGTGGISARHGARPGETYGGTRFVGLQCRTVSPTPGFFRDSQML